MQNLNQGRIRVAISGGGLGGLTLALVLSKYAKDLIDIDLYEAGPEFATVGAGITVWQRTRSILQTLGLSDALQKKAASPPVKIRKSDDKDGGFEFHELVVPHGSVALHRAEMLKLLTDELTPERVPQFHARFSKRLTSYEQDDSGVTLHFADDSSTARADMLIGADGVGSPTRRKMYEDLAGHVEKTSVEEAEALRKFIPPTWTGTYAYRALIEREKLVAVDPEHPALTQGLIWIGKDKHIISYPISISTINILFFDTVKDGLGKTLNGPSAVEAQKEEVIELLKDWEPNARILAELIASPSKWAINHVRGLPTYIDGCVALLGDSAHAMSTHLGAGAGQAIEDAYVLGRILAFSASLSGAEQFIPVDIPGALKVYDAVRRPIAEDVVERSLTLGFLYELDPAHLPTDIDEAQLALGDRAALAKLMEEVMRIWGFHWESMPEEDWVTAQEMLRARQATL